MDISLNKIDLMYLSRPNKLKKIYQTHDPVDVSFYKERIIHMTNQLLGGQSINTLVDKMFQEYIEICVQHFQFMDKSDAIQKDYLKLQNKKIKFPPIPLENCNKVIMKPPRNKTMLDYVTIVKKPLLSLPKVRVLNLKDESLKYKGTEKK